MILFGDFEVNSHIDLDDIKQSIYISKSRLLAMKDMTDEMTEKVHRFATFDLPFMISEATDECVKRGVKIDFIRDNVEELGSLVIAWINEEFKLCKEITGRSNLTSEEIISVLADRIIKYAEEKHKLKG